MLEVGLTGANAGEATPPTTAAKMANNISGANAIHKKYQPVDSESVRQSNEAEQMGPKSLNSTRTRV
ncbi:hypothetical protein CU103_15050 [Phyllobacterium sophorae]|uniref:Uncharacterized protein n=1 Tax=Phyllobacterium sophorae TaxID=1520277 RepID=A0A2P7BAS4_9HYPH|nr:hypothetical protein CU103_15050 [Phyllobacterium sophorae]